MKNWLLIANAARARVLEQGPGSCTHVADLVHPQSRQKGVELSGDRCGHVDNSGHGEGGSAYQPRTGAHEREHDRFAREVAALLNHGVAAGHCAGLVLVASNPFLGHVKSHLSAQAAKVVVRTEAADYTVLRDDEVIERLRSQ